MKEIIYKIEFFSDWHCGSGLSSGVDLDLLVIKDPNRLPYIPGRTVKGVLKDAAFSLMEFGSVDEPFITTVFGRESVEAAEGSTPEASIRGDCFFSNAELTQHLQDRLKDKQSHLYRKIASTAIEENGQAKAHSLRKIEVVVPLTLFGRISRVPDEQVDHVERCMKFVKRMGTGRNRGYGRCSISIDKGGVQ